ncbi:MAG: MSMEG_4193 family putative phosphomutase [Acidimicrobiia bacterium]
MTRILLIRHASTAETGKTLSGRLPGIPLSAKGRKEALAMADALGTLSIAAVYSSPIERTVETATIIAAAAHQLRVKKDKGLLEADYGDWSGKKLAQLRKAPEWPLIQRAPSHAAFPGGETMRAMQNRIIEAIPRLAAAHANETIVLVSHADPIKSYIAHALGMHLDQFQRIDIAPASLTRIDMHHGLPRIVSMNVTAESVAGR